MSLWRDYVLASIHARLGRPWLPPGIYFRPLLVGYFEGIDSERGIAWRVADSLALRRFLRIGLEERTPDHSTISRTRRLIDVETHREVFTWVLELLAERGLLKGRRWASTRRRWKRTRRCDRSCGGTPGRATRSFSRIGEGVGDRDADAGGSGAAGPQAEEEDSNKEWKNPHDQDARIAKMKDGRTHLAHKAEHAVDLETGAVVAVTLQGADQGDTTTLDETLCEAGEQVAEQMRREAELRPQDKPKVHPQGIEELVTDKGYHSGAVVQRVKSYEVRTYIPEKKQKGRRDWQGRRGRAAGGVRESAAGAGRVRQDFTAAARRVGGAQLRALLRDGRDAALPSARAGEHSETAVGTRGSIQPESDSAKTAGSGYAARTEKSRGPGSFATLALYAVPDDDPFAGPTT